MPKILVVDDVYSARLKTMLLLRNAGVYTVFSANNGAASLKLALTIQPDVIVMDIIMPDMDGITALQELRARGITCPVIAYTSRREERPGEFRAYGFDAYVSRSESSHKLLDTVSGLVQHQGQALSNYVLSPL
jgi:CheY-like chemotaxis protein